MVTTSAWASAGPGTSCGLPGGHGGTVTYIHTYVAAQSHISGNWSLYKHLDRRGMRPADAAHSVIRQNVSRYSLRAYQHVTRFSTAVPSRL
jgi:hypothetical protein